MAPDSAGSNKPHLQVAGLPCSLHRTTVSPASPQSEGGRMGPVR